MTDPTPIRQPLDYAPLRGLAFLEDLRLRAYRAERRERRLWLAGWALSFALGYGIGSWWGI